MINLTFESAALPVDTFQILKFDGEEAVSQLFRFELQLVSRDPDIDFDAVLEASAKLAITTEDNTRYLHGMLSKFEQCGEWQNGMYEYRAVMVPRLWIMAQSAQNQIFQDLTVPDIIESELGSIQAKGSHPLVMDGLSVDDYELYLTRNYREREYTVQYKETDLNFISRLMEHEGIYYYFEHDENREKVVITDTMATEEIAGDSYTEYMTESATARYDRNVVYKLKREKNQIPDSVMVKDFNYRSPSLPMQADSVVGDNGIGFVTEFGAHFKDPEDGEILATIRAEEYRCRQDIYSGESNVAAFCCGGLYSLGQHFRREYNQTYMITRVRHSGSQEIETWNNIGSTHYHNRFDCIPSGLPYRPQRLTPKPKLYGIMNGTIDSELDTGRADLDEQGRYKVMMPFDISGVAPGLASRRIRMAQPYGGGGAGMSFPLVKGTEVIWTCIDGDIDRPIITGAVPNPLNPSVTSAENNTSNVIKTSSGITMGFHDGTASASQNATGGGAGNGLAAQLQYQKAGDSDESSFQSSPLTMQHQQMAVDLLNISGITDPSSDASSFDDDGSGAGKQWSIAVPDYDPATDDKDTYLRYGMPSRGEATMSDFFGNDGILSYTDGNMHSYTQGSRHDIISSGNYELEINKDGGGVAYSDKFTKGADRANAFALIGMGSSSVLREIYDETSTVSYTMGDNVSLAGGFKLNGQISETCVNVMGRFSVSGDSDLTTAILGTKVLAGTNMLNTCFGPSLTAATATEVSGSVSTKINVKAPVGFKATAASAASLLATLQGAIIKGGGLALGAHGTVSAATGRTGEGDLAGAAAGMGAAILAKTAINATLNGQQAAHTALPPLTELSLSIAKIRLGIGPGPVSTPVFPGLDIAPGRITLGFGMGAQIIITPEGIRLQSAKVTLDGLAVEVGAPMTADVKINAANVDIKAKAKMDMAAPNVKGVAGMLTL